MPYSVFTRILGINRALEFYRGLITYNSYQKKLSSSLIFTCAACAYSFFMHTVQKQHQFSFKTILILILTMCLQFCTELKCQARNRDHFQLSKYSLKFVKIKCNFFRRQVMQPFPFSRYYMAFIMHHMW